MARPCHPHVCRLRLRAGISTHHLSCFPNRAALCERVNSALDAPRGSRNVGEFGPGQKEGKARQVSGIGLLSAS
eukprot:9199167-Alexandrium_andersonii.AAC.1